MRVRRSVEQTQIVRILKGKFPKIKYAVKMTYAVKNLKIIETIRK